MTIALSGASGILGSAIGKRLKEQGSDPIQLVRRPAKGPGELEWNPAFGPSQGPNLHACGRIEGITAAIHLSGANISSQRWTAEFKAVVTESRVRSTQVLSEMLGRLKNPPHSLLVGSAVGFYGDRGNELLDEHSAVGKGFLPELCAAWEAATRPAEEAGIRVVHLRFGVVLGPNGGALARVIPLFRLGLGGKLGSGRQWMSWISKSDAVSAVLFTLENPGISGPVNIVAPEPVTNAIFTRELGHALRRPALLPAPAFALRLAFGEMADEILLASERAIPGRLLGAGFTFAHSALSDALAAALTGNV
jgi:uncharacterized protein (TIGR01777 family)